MSNTPLTMDKPIYPWDMQTRSQCVLHAGLELTKRCASPQSMLYAGGKCVYTWAIYTGI